MSSARRLHHSDEEYLRTLELSAVKLEYCEGEMYAMAVGTPARADLAASMTRLLGNALLGQCRVSSSDLKVRIEATDLSTFAQRLRRMRSSCGSSRKNLARLDSIASRLVFTSVAGAAALRSVCRCR